MPSEYTTPVLDYISLAAEQFPHQTHQQYRDHQQQQQPQQQQQHHQQQQQHPHQSSPQTMPMTIPTSLSIPTSPVMPLNLSSGSTVVQTQPQPQVHSQTPGQAKICPVCHCALVPESSDIIHVQGVPNVVCAACIASELLQQFHRRQTEESLNYSSIASAPIPPQGFSIPSGTPSISPDPNVDVTSLSPLSVPTQHAMVVESQLVTLTCPSAPSTTIDLPSSSIHRSPPMPIGENTSDRPELETDDDEERRHTINQDEVKELNGYILNESRIDYENAEMFFDAQEVQDSLGLGLDLLRLNVKNCAANIDIASLCRSDSGLNSAEPSLDGAAVQPRQMLSSSANSPSTSLQPLPHQSSLAPALSLLPSSSQTAQPTHSESEPEAAPEPLAQVTHHTSSHPFTPPMAMSPASSNSILCSSFPKTNSHNLKCFEPDPLTDISRLRVRSHTQDCLYPGAQFCGTQKSGRSSYDVSVTIVDVDFQSSFLCGYLRIRGLTDDWPELTTYFDAEIIGSRYGFLTQDWGASEAEDVTHWSRFPAYERVKPLMWGPKMNIPDDAGLGKGLEPSATGAASASASRSFAPGNGGCVFMRWKERFLVPDHRVRDINGASFAGFYYVCVEFNPARSNASLKRRRKKVERRPSGGYTPRDVNMTAMRDQQIRDQIASSTNINSNANVKPPDTDVEMDITEDSNNNVRRQTSERRFIGMEMDMDMDMQIDFDAASRADRLEDVSTPPSRSRSLIRERNGTSPSRSRTRRRRRREREEQQYDRYRTVATQNAVEENTTPVAVPVSLSNSNLTPNYRALSGREMSQHSISQSLPLPTPPPVGPEDNCDEISMSYREWTRVMGRERERGRETEYSHERGRGLARDMQSRSGIEESQHFISPLQTTAQAQAQTHTRTVVEPDSEDSESEYEYEYEYDESVYSDDPAYDDTLGSTPGGPYTATMSGFYFHQHSEPYQQLSLRYVPRRSTGSFEFR